MRYNVACTRINDLVSQCRCRTASHVSLADHIIEFTQLHEPLTSILYTLVSSTLSGVKYDLYLYCRFLVSHCRESFLPKTTFVKVRSNLRKVICKCYIFNESINYETTICQQHNLQCQYHLYRLLYIDFVIPGADFINLPNFTCNYAVYWS